MMTALSNDFSTKSESNLFTHTKVLKSMYHNNF